MSFNNLFGNIFNLAQLYEGDIIYESVYSDIFAKYYDMLPKNDAECENYLSEAYSCGKNVLELCCGNGRLTTYFLEKGFTVDGIDISEDMLALLEKKRHKLPKSLSRNLKIICDDVFSYCPESEKYDFILLPCMTICILSDQEDLTKQLFKNISTMLKPHGSFMFDMRRYDKGSEDRQSELLLNTFTIDDKPGMLLMQESLRYSIGRAIANLYLEMDEGEGCVKRYIATTNKRMVSIEDLADSISSAGLYVNRKTTIHEGNTIVDFFTLKKIDDCEVQ